VATASSGTPHPIVTTTSAPQIAKFWDKMEDIVTKKGAFAGDKIKLLLRPRRPLVPKEPKMNPLLKFFFLSLEKKFETIHM
jgi:hypothetical protein